MDFEQQLAQMLNKVPYGKVYLEISQYDGQPTAITRYEEYRSIKTSDNTSTGAYILQMIKDINDDGRTGSVTLTMNYRKGKVTNLVVNSEQNKETIK